MKKYSEYLNQYVKIYKLFKKRLTYAEKIKWNFVSASRMTDMEERISNFS